jgi:hypothetical protein
MNLGGPALALTVGLIAISILILLAVHFYWAAGGKNGKSAAIPEVEGAPLLQPSALATSAVALALLAIAGLLALRISDAAPVSLQILVKSGTWIVALIFAARALGFPLRRIFQKCPRDLFRAAGQSLLFAALCFAGRFDRSDRIELKVHFRRFSCCSV